MSAASDTFRREAMPATAIDAAGKGTLRERGFSAVLAVLGLSDARTARAIFALLSRAKVPGITSSLILASTGINLLGLALPLALVQIYDRIIPNAAIATLGLLVIGVTTALVLEAILRLARAHICGWLGAKIEHNGGMHVMERLMRSRLSDLENSGAGTQLERFQSLQTLKEFYGGQGISVVCDFPFAVIYLAVIGYLAGWLVIVPITLIAAVSALAYAVGLRLRRSIDARQAADHRRYDFIIEVLGGIHTVKAMAMENLMVRRYERLQQTSAISDRDTIEDNTTALTLGAVAAQISIFAVVAFGAISVIHGGLTIGTLVACTLLTGRAMQPLQRALGIWSRLQSIRMAHTQIGQIMALPEQHARDLPRLKQTSGAIAVADVSFGFSAKFGASAAPVIRHLDLEIGAGEMIGITGDGAAGKSTLLGLIAGIHPPSEGRVLIDGHDIHQFDPSSIRAQIGYIPQDGALFSGTILDNITMFRREFEEAGRAVARPIGLEAMIMRTPLGYDTPVGATATDALARGMKQRILTARALVTDPRILLFDEANAAIDGSGDAMLRDLLGELKGRRTIILVSHRPSILRLTDRTYEMRDGRLHPWQPIAPTRAVSV